MPTRFEDERNNIYEHYYFDVEMNKTARKMYEAALVPEPDARASMSLGMRKPFSNFEALNNPIALNIGFYFSKKTAPLAVVFRFTISYKDYSRKGSIEREYVGAHTEGDFDTYSIRYLQSARTVVTAVCDEYALKTSNIKNPTEITIVVSKIYYQILEQWSHLK
jgi:hypothetical protein